MIPIIGGKLDGTHAAGKVLEFSEDGENYMLISFDEEVGEKKVRRQIYVLAGGVTISEAIKLYKERAKVAGGFQRL